MPVYRIAAVYLPDLRLIVEIDGRWPDPEADRAKDERFLAARGIRTSRLNEQVLSGRIPGSVARRASLLWGTGMYLFPAA